MGDRNQVTGKLNDGKRFSGRITDNDQFIGTVSNMAVELDINDWFGQAESNDIPITVDRIRPIFFLLPLTGIKNGRADITVNINGKRHETTADFRFDQISILNHMIGGLNGTINLSDKRLTASYPRPAAGQMKYSPDTGWSIEHAILGGDIKCITPHFGVGAMGDHSICDAVVADISLDQVLDLTSAHMLEASGTLNGTVALIRDGDRVKIGNIRLSGTTGAISLADGGALSGNMAGVNQHLKNLALDNITITRRPTILNNHEKPIKLTARGHRPDGQAVKLTLHLDIISDQLDRLIK
jgi:small nuclear ribonucleoprotein (snRNP)-like protein